MSFACFHVLPGAEAHGITYIQKICNRVERFNKEIPVEFCVSSLQTVPESYTTEIQGLLKITTELALRNATRTTQLIKKMIDLSCDFVTKDHLEVCLGMYTEATSILQSSATAFGSLQYDDGEKLGSVVEGAAKCEEQSSKGEGEGFPSHEALLNEENDNLRQLVSIAQALHRFVTKHRH
ncbi:hypothetical protein H6P81_016525 [Aristolochia fimbriata]|uniref:Pectinesterase inhibitor domain-containing protein n=1 Tax=Aristolochia fimbriata TaxID=158543 RepID=A0AAV7E8I0_ARIFI|nr:hypothetical protein H6P81_016525 [Aristolochia fimbriata]